MESWQRTFAYVSGSVVFGLLLIIFTNSLLVYVARPDWVGYAALFGFGLVYLSMSYNFNRRFTKKRKRPSWISYLMATLLILPTLLWIFTKETDLAEARLMFALTISFAAYLGAYYGIKGGMSRRAEYLKQVRETEEDMPEDLKRSHDKMSKN